MRLKERFFLSDRWEKEWRFALIPRAYCSRTHLLVRGETGTGYFPVKQARQKLLLEWGMAPTIPSTLK
jgi:hypothetical protein